MIQFTTVIMLEEEINLLLKNIKSELNNFVKFVKSVEEEHNNNLPDTEQSSENNTGAKKKLRRIAEDDNNDAVESNAVWEAFEIAKNVLQKTYDLLDQFASLQIDIPPDSDSFLVNFYYKQYVYRIASYMINMLEENLNRFSENLKKLSAPKPESEPCHLPPSQQNKLPGPFKFKYFKPATLFTPDDELYEPFRAISDESELISDPDIWDPSALAFEDMSSDECAERDCNAEDSPYAAVLNRITESLNLLVPILENVLLQLKKSRDVQAAPSFGLTTLDDSVRADSETKPGEIYCTLSCERCCKSCRLSHRLLKLPEGYQKPKVITVLRTTDGIEPFWFNFPGGHPDQQKADCGMKNNRDAKQQTDNGTRMDVKEGSRQKRENITVQETNKDIRMERSKYIGPEICPHNCAPRPTSINSDDRMEQIGPELYNSPSQFKLLGKLFQILNGNNCTKKIKKKTVSRGDLRSSASDRKTLTPKAERHSKKQSHCEREKVITRETNSGLKSGQEACSHRGAPRPKSKKSKDGTERSELIGKLCDVKTKELKLLGNIYEMLMDKNVTPDFKKRRVSSGDLKSLTSNVRKTPSNTLTSERELNNSKKHSHSTEQSSSDEERVEKITRSERKYVKPKSKHGKREREGEGHSGCEQKPILARDLKKAIFSEGKISNGFCLLPNEEEETTSDVPSSEPAQREPREIVLNINQFSQLLREKFGRHFATISDDEKNSQTQIILDLLGCLKQSTDICWDIVESSQQTHRSSPAEMNSDTDSDGDADHDKAVDILVNKVITVAKAIADAEGFRKHDVLSPEERKTLETLDDVKVFPTGSRASEHSMGILISNASPHLKMKKQLLSHTCVSCMKMLQSLPALDGRLTDRHQNRRKKFLPGKLFKDTCFRCWNSCQRGLTIHQCHDKLPVEIFEIRHMDKKFGKICVCFAEWNRSIEIDDWRWQKSPFCDQTRVEIQKKSSAESDTLLMVIYGPEGNMVKESLGETRLRTVVDFPRDIIHSKQDKKDNNMNKTSSDSDAASTIQSRKQKKENYRRLYPQMSEEQRNTMSKLGSFYDEVQLHGYGNGPLLVIKLRRNNALSDAYDLLMAPSNVHLHYYRSLRVIFDSKDKYKTITTSSNFQEEDQSDELFELFANKIFGTEEFHLFEYADEGAEYLYFNHGTQAHPQWFVFAGTVLGLAFLHQKEMKIKFAPCIFSSLLNRQLSLMDVQEIDPIFHQKLMWVKKNNMGNSKGKMTFVVREKIGGNRTKEIELVSGGKTIAVTEKNKYRYIDLATKWKLAETCLIQLKDFRKGFASVINPGFLTRFTNEELHYLIRNPPSSEIFNTEHDTEKPTRELFRSETW